MKSVRCSSADATADQPSLADLPGLGPRSQQMLAGVGIQTSTQLRHIGVPRAYVMVRRHDPRASLNLLWGLAAALSGEPWQQIAREHRTSLLLAVEQAEHELVDLDVPDRGQP